MAAASHNAASPWVQLLTDEDEPYYYNESTDETTWETPPEGVSEFRGKEEDEDEDGEGEGEGGAAAAEAEADADGRSPLPAAAPLADPAFAELQALLGQQIPGAAAAASPASPGIADEAASAARVSDLRRENDALRLAATRTEAAAARNEAQKRDLQLQAKDLSAALKTAHDRESETQGRLAQVQSEHALLGERLRSVEADAEAARERDTAGHVKGLQQVRAKADYATAQTTRLQSERSELRSEVTRLEARLAEEIAKAAAAVAKGHQHEAASATLSVKEAEAAELREALSQCESLVETQRSKTATVAAERDALAQDVAELEGTVAATSDLHSAELQKLHVQSQVSEDTAEEAAAALWQATADRSQLMRESETLRVHLRKGTALIARQHTVLDRLGADAAVAAPAAPRTGGSGKRSVRSRPPPSSTSPSGAARASPRRPASRSGKQSQQQRRATAASPEEKGSPSTRGNKTTKGGGQPSGMFAREQERLEKKRQVRTLTNPQSFLTTYFVLRSAGRSVAFFYALFGASSS